MKRILIADDEYSIIEVLGMVLEGDGYAVVSAANGKEALESVRSQSIDLVLLDLMMPVMDGLELLGIMRADERLRRVPVILMSAGSPNVLEIKNEYSAYLPKPFNLPDLLKTIHDVIGE